MNSSSLEFFQSFPSWVIAGLGLQMTAGYSFSVNYCWSWDLLFYYPNMVWELQKWSSSLLLSRYDSHLRQTRRQGFKRCNGISFLEFITSLGVNVYMNSPSFVSTIDNSKYKNFRWFFTVFLCQYRSWISGMEISKRSFHCRQFHLE